MLQLIKCKRYFWLRLTHCFPYLIGKPLTTLSDHRISLQCLQDYMLLEMDLQDIPKLEPTSLHLRHFSCKPQVTNTRAIFQVPFQGCGTTLGTELNHIVYKNVVDNSQQINGSRVGVRHAPELYYPFACRYRQKYIVTLREDQKGSQGNENGQEKGNQTREGNVIFVNPSFFFFFFFKYFALACFSFVSLGYRHVSPKVFTQR